AEWRFLLAGGNPASLTPNPSPDWISERSWIEILSLTGLSTFANMTSFFLDNSETFKIIFDATEPQMEPLPEPWETKLSRFQKILILRAIRPDKVTNAFQDYVAANLGQRFIEPQTNDLNSIYKDASPVVPLVFILSSGTDPGGELIKFAEKMKFGKKMNAISLGQGQGPRAEILMRTAMESGLWCFFKIVILHLVHSDFRLWLTSMPSPNFPAFILQNSAKMTVEPPRGIKANLLKVYSSLTDNYMDSCVGRAMQFKCMLFSLTLFHSVVVERRKFGSLGFNIAYDFTDGDFKICMSQLFMFLMEYEQIAFKVLKYTAAEVNYGGRITDDWDRRLVKTIIDDYYRMEVIKTSHVFDPVNKIYCQLNPEITTINDYVEYIRSLPINDNPDIFGLHENANITYAQNELFINLQNLLLQQPQTVDVGAGGLSRDDVIYASALRILDLVVQPVDLGPVQAKYPILYDESMNTVLIQELLRYNNILNVVHVTLRNLLKALKGLMVLTTQLEEVSVALFNNTVPLSWKKISYPSLKPLASWVLDLRARMNMFFAWCDKGIPSVFWFSGLWFPQAFLTGTTQNYARKMKIPIDILSWNYQIILEPKDKLSRPADGCYIYGMFIEGARWDKAEFSLVESNPKELFTEMPVFLLMPAANRGPPGGPGMFVSPIYKTLLRAGTLTTSGHSTNYIIPVEVPSKNPQSHWIKRGVAM
uniref:Uncharacterized protein n=1 Tax=Strigamia maritima TaxID=126957 RepID=T1J5R6_STRMM